MRKLIGTALAIALVLAPLAIPQRPWAENQPSVLSSGPPNDNITIRKAYDGSNNLEYVCYAPYTPAQPSFSWTIAGSTLTSIVDSTNTSTVTTSTAHGLVPGNVVTVSGEAGDTDLNGSYIVATVGSATTFTITTASVTDATYNTTGLTVSTTAPRTTALIWSINRKTYTSTYETASMWAYASVASKTVTAKAKWTFACASASTYAYK